MAITNKQLAQVFESTAPTVDGAPLIVQSTALVTNLNADMLDGQHAADFTPIAHVGAGGTAHAEATTSVAGFISAADKTKLDAIEANANNYSLPIASAGSLGGIRVGSGLAIDGSGILSATGGGGGIVWTAITSNTAAVSDNGYIIDSSLNPVTLTFPASPSVGDVIGVSISNNTNVITLARNGNLLLGDAEDKTITGVGNGIQFVYTGASFGWASTTELSSGIPSGPVASGSSLIVELNQAAHGFTVGQPIRHNGTSWVLSIASSDATAEVYGIVSEVVDVDNFKVTTDGDITLSGLTAGQAYFLSPTVAGTLTTTIPTTIGHVIKPVLLAYSTTKAVVNLMRGNVVQDSAGAFDIADLPAALAIDDLDQVAVSVSGQMRRVTVGLIRAGMAVAIATTMYSDIQFIYSSEAVVVNTQAAVFIEDP